MFVKANTLNPHSTTSTSPPAVTPAPNLSLTFKASATAQQRELAEGYWTQGKYSWQLSETQLGKHFGLKKTDVWPTVNLTAVAVHPHLLCTLCGKPYSYHDRADYERVQRLENPIYTCAVCAAEQNQRRIDVIHREFALGKHDALDVTRLSLSEAVFLLALVQERGSTDGRTILAGKEMEDTTPLTMESAATHQFLINAYQRGHLLIHPSTSPNACVWEGETVKGFKSDQVRWTLPAGESLDFTDVAALLESTVTDVNLWAEQWHSEVEALMLTLLQQEAVATLKLQLQRRSLPTEISDEARDLLYKMLQKLSLGQVWNIIWQSVASASDWRISTPGISYEKAGKAVLTHMKKRAERYALQGPKPSGRDHEIPVPVMSHVLFTQVLGYTEQGYTEIFLLRGLNGFVPSET